MSNDVLRDFMAVTVAELRSYRRLAEKALAQVPDEALHRSLDPESNSLAVLVRHVGNNLRSRWTEFLTTDGEKPDRHRDAEFEASALSRDQLMSIWNDGWDRTLATLGGLSLDDLGRSVTVRGEPHTVPRAIQRSLAHIALHVGQIVMLAKHHAGPAWKTLSVPRGESEAFNARVREKFGAG